ncbi:hypothetical protein D9M68_892110 [compost metagenome]
MFLGHEDHADAVFARGRQGHALGGHFFTVQGIGQLDQDAGTVAHELVRPHRAPMVQVFQDLQTLLHDGMAFFALDMGHEADTAGVVFVGRVVQTLLLELLLLGCRGHGASFSIQGRDKNTRDAKHSALQQRCQAF